VRLSELSDWQDNIDNYIVIQKTMQSATAYLIVNLSEKQPYNIEDNAVARWVAEKMIEAGVKVMSVQEAQNLMFPKPVPNLNK
jgi:flavin-dependent dehydrogenase